MIDESDPIDPWKYAAYALRAELERVEGERDAAQSERDGAREIRDEWMAKADATIRERDEWLAKADYWQKEIARHVEQTITFRGSITDLATDVAELLKTREDMEVFLEHLAKKPCP